MQRGASKALAQQLNSLHLGDLIQVQWCDASVGKSLQGGSIDVPVDSYGIYISCLGEKRKHIILAQNSFKYANGLYDIDYTAIPLAWSVKVSVIKPCQVDEETANCLLRSLLQGHARTLKRRIKNHGS